jgi:hypothetical protein
MRRVLLISLTLVLALVAWTAASAEDIFYVVPVVKERYAPVPKTGQTTSYAAGDDGALHMGVASPTPRFTDNNNGTVTDNLTGLIWMKNANGFGQKTWDQAVIIANGLKSGDTGTGLTDGSTAGEWRLPNVRELQSLIDYSQYGPALPINNHFANVQWSYYWSSTTNPANPTSAWSIYLYDGYVDFFDGPDPNNKQTSTYYVWCVRGGR